MARELDFAWLLQQAADRQSRQWICRIREWRDFSLKRNEFIKSRRLFSVRLGRYRLWFRASAAFASSEIYIEIFKDNEHALIEEFSGASANWIVDLGANEGFYALKIKECNPQCKILCVEPNPYVFEMLKRNIESNGVKDVVLVNKAVGSRNGKMPFEVIREIGAIGGKSLRTARRAWLKDEFIERMAVEAVTLETLLREHNVSTIDILKMDVEGMELEILQSSRFMFPKVHRIVVERHSRGLRDAVVKLLTAHGFDLVFEVDPKHREYYGDLYFVNRNWEDCSPSLKVAR